MSDYKPRNESRGEGREGREGGANRRYISRPKFCQFCSDKNLVIDYKNVEMMTRFINETGKIRCIYMIFEILRSFTQFI